MQILYVDDDRDDRDLFVDALNQLDPKITVSAFANGKEILTFLHSGEHIPRFIFIDINMPMMDGHECAARIREIERLNNSGIVMFSTAFNSMDIKKFNEKNYKFLVKPADYNVLIQSIRKFIE